MAPLDKPAASLCAALRVVLAAGMALSGAAILVLPTAARAADPLSFTIPAEDGYGIADCMQAGSACGQAMATSWCEAHGHPHAAAYGMAADVTGSIGQPAQDVPDAGAVVIRCSD